jgi:aminopeptidase N
VKTRIVIAVLLGLALPIWPSAADAKKKAKKPSLAITWLSAHAGKKIGPGERFRVTGTIRNTGHAASPALVSATLRRGGKTAFVLGSTNIKRIRGRHTQKFTLAATGPLLPVGAADRRYVLMACVRARRGAGSSCRHTRHTQVVVAPSSHSGSGGTPGGGTPGSGTPGSGTPGGDTFTAGSRSAGDRLFPGIGNGGYDARHYDLALSYDPSTRRLHGTATIEAAATQNLSEFSLDLYNMPATSVLVDGQPATFKQQAGKLIVTPPQGVKAATTFTTIVAYGTAITAYTDPDGSSEGWVPSSDGAFVVNEPVGAMSWFPNNNVPADKATYDLRITVPASREVIANGRLASNTLNADGTRSWHWVEDSPMASYLVTATNGDFDMTVDNATHTYYGLDSSYTLKSQMQSRLDQTPAIIDFYAGYLGTPYPFTSMGGVVDRSSVGYALETQTKPMYAVSNAGDPSNPDLATISHELAHQWFGDDVSPATWSDIWLNEGPAEFFSWLWQERSGNSPLTTKQRFDTSYADPNMSWSIPPAAPPTAADMFDTDAMYTRGAMVMEALREIAGEDRFKAVLKTYLAAHKYGNATTQQFIDLWKSDGGKDPARLDAFFKQWLYGTEKPTITPSNF